MPDSNRRSPVPQTGALTNYANPTISGAPKGTRTPDLLLRRQLLYPAELLAHRRKHIVLSLERVMGIEPTRPAWKAGILPLNYTRISAFQVAFVCRFSGCRFSATFVIISHSFFFVKRFFRFFILNLEASLATVDIISRQLWFVNTFFFQTFKL